MATFQEILLEKLHRDFLTEHHNDHPFPLDGSEWSRLVSMRLDREYHHRECMCETCANLLTRLHQNGILQHERMAVPRAMAYWFMHDPRLTQVATFHPEETTSEQALRTLDAMDVGNLSLARVENDWLKKRMKGWTALPGKYWLPDTAEEFEAHPVEPKTILSNVRAKEPQATEPQATEQQASEMAESK